jgi:large subunit ribosomal protein L25
MKRSVFTLEVESREQMGTAHTRRLRLAGKIPVVMYSHGEESKPLTISAVDAAEVVHHHGMLSVSNKTDGKTALAIIKDIDYSCITQKVMHIDFLEVHAGEKITAEVALSHKGDPAGLGKGGILEQMLHSLSIRCTPENLPEAIIVDVSSLDLDQIIHVNEIPLPEGVAVMTDGKLPAFMVSLPRVDEEPTPAAAGTEAATPAAAAPAAGEKDTKKQEKK